MNANSHCSPGASAQWTKLALKKMLQVGVLGHKRRMQELSTVFSIITFSFYLDLSLHQLRSLLLAISQEQTTQGFRLALLPGAAFRRHRCHDITSCSVITLVHAPPAPSFPLLHIARKTQCSPALQASLWQPVLAFPRPSSVTRQCVTLSCLCFSFLWVLSIRPSKSVVQGKNVVL